MFHSREREVQFFASIIFTEQFLFWSYLSIDKQYLFPLALIFRLFRPQLVGSPEIDKFRVSKDGPCLKEYFFSYESCPYIW